MVGAAGPTPGPKLSKARNQRADAKPQAVKAQLSRRKRMGAASSRHFSRLRDEEDDGDGRTVTRRNKQPDQFEGTEVRGSEERQQQRSKQQQAQQQLIRIPLAQGH